MSNIDRVPDDLSAKMGGQEPFFYAFCQTYWSRLGNLVAESVDPRVQLANNPHKLPAVDSYLITQDAVPSTGGDEPGNTSTHISMASWVQKTIKWGFPNREQRYLVTKTENFRDRQNGGMSLTTQYLVGRDSTLRTVLHSDNTECTLSSARGIEALEVDLLVDEMSGPKHEVTVGMVTSLRENARKQSDLIAESLPGWMDIKSGVVNSSNLVTVDGKPVENIAIQISNLAKLEQNKLPLTHNVELLHNKVRIGAAAASLLLLPYQLG